MAVELSVVMPCLNEAETLAACISDARSFLDRTATSGEIIVCDNGSTDGSVAIAEHGGARLVHVEAKGYGNAILGGIAAAEGEYIVMGDADQSYDFAALDPFLEQLRAGADLVMGNRFRGGIKPGAMPALHRYLGNPLLSFLGRLFFDAPCRDFHCGLRGFRRDSVTDLDLSTGGMEFASEMVVKACLTGQRIVEVPTVLRPDGRTRPPHLRTWRDGWRHLRFLLLYSPRWLFLYPGIALTVVGGGLGTWLMVKPIRIGSIGLDVGAMTYAFGAAYIGVQAVSFAVLTRTYAQHSGLLPQQSRLADLHRRVTLERGLVIAVALVLIGIVATVVSVLRWQQADFGKLNPAQQIRTVTPAVVGLVLGAQVAMSSVFVSMMQLQRKGTDTDIEVAHLS